MTATTTELGKKTIYSSLKAFRYEEQLKALREGTAAAPVHIRIKPTNACNHDCWFCAYRVDHLTLGETMRERDSLPEAKWFEIIDDVISMGVKAVTFSGGGEPLIYKHLARGINKLGEGGVKVATLTNGRYLQGDIGEAFAKYGSWVRVSMDYWDGASLAKSRGVKEAEFAMIIENMRSFAARKSPCELGVSFIVTKEDHTHIYDFCKLMKEIGVDHVKLSGCVVSVNGKENNAYHAEIKEEVGRQLARAKELADGDFKVVDHYHELEERFDKPYTSCPYLQFLTVIGADCSVYTCQDKAYMDDGLLGNIKERSFKSFWFSEENKKAMRAVDPSKICSHHCVSHAKNLLLHEYLALDPEHLGFV